MSLFLGPIHMWLFTKIKFEDRLQRKIMDEYEKDRKETKLSKQLEEHFRALEEGELQDIIEGDNIHGWLQERVSLVESRLAFTVTGILKDDPDAMEYLKEIAFQFGKANAVPTASSAGQAYKMLDDLLLNGMPCDGVNEIIQETDNRLIFQQTKDIHRPYWDGIDGEVDHYHEIRKSLIAGLLYQSGYRMDQLDDQTFELRKEA